MLRMQWFKDSYLNDLREGKILDVGSYNVNGCYKEIFEENRFDYLDLKFNGEIKGIK